MIVDNQQTGRRCILAYPEGIDLAFEPLLLLENFADTNNLIVDRMPRKGIVCQLTSIIKYFLHKYIDIGTYYHRYYS